MTDAWFVEIVPNINKPNSHSGVKILTTSMTDEHDSWSMNHDPFPKNLNS